MNHKPSIPQWIMIYGAIQVVLVIGFGAMFFADSIPDEANNPSWFVGGRNVAVLAVLLLGLIRRDAKYLLAAFLLRFIIDFGDMTNNLIAGEIATALTFIPFLLAPLAFGVWTLWNLAEAPVGRTGQSTV